MRFKNKVRRRRYQLSIVVDDRAREGLLLTMLVVTKCGVGGLMVLADVDLANSGLHVAVG
jgi:hypothetical protein